MMDAELSARVPWEAVRDLGDQLAGALADRDRARDVAVALEQELAELRARVDAVVVSAVAFRGWDDSHTVWELDDVAMLALSFGVARPEDL